MQTGNNRDTRLIAWNGIRFSTPAVWETRVNEACHLIIENQFEPVLQLRWNKKKHYSPREVRRITATFTAQAQGILSVAEISQQWLPFIEKYQPIVCSRDEEGNFSGGVFSCSHCQTLFQFQIFCHHQPMAQQISRCLATLSCHGQQENLWRIQDFSLISPPSFALTHYSFKAGMTRLAFCKGYLELEVCKMAPADARLSRQSLAEILCSLTGAPELTVQEDQHKDICEGLRNPGIIDRFLLRMRRHKPFIQAKIWHSRTHNRLLALSLAGSRPIPSDILPTLAANYEIV